MFTFYFSAGAGGTLLARLLERYPHMRGTRLSRLSPGAARTSIAFRRVSTHDWGSVIARLRGYGVLSRRATRPENASCWLSNYFGTFREYDFLQTGFRFLAPNVFDLCSVKVKCKRFAIIKYGKNIASLFDDNTAIRAFFAICLKDNMCGRCVALLWASPTLV